MLHRTARYLKERPWLLLTSVASLTFGMLVGLQSGQAEGGEAFELIKSLRQLAELYRPFEPLTVAFIFAKNTLTIFLIYFAGACLIVPSLLIVLLNGLVIGMVFSAVAEAYSLPTALASLAPHGTFEVPALIVASALGVDLGVAVVRKMVSAFTRSKVQLKEVVKEQVLMLLTSAIPLLFVAALIETYVTPLASGL